MQPIEEIESTTSHQAVVGIDDDKGILSALREGGDLRLDPLTGIVD
jgi:hypothetical protein